MKLKPSLTLDAASTIMDSALAYGRAENLLPLTVVILDAGGKMIASKSEDGSGIMRFDIARGKAWGALGMGISSRLIRDRLSARPTFVTALAAVANGQFVPVPGGVLIEDADGFTIGAVGISGDTSEKDEYCAIRAVQDAGLRAEPAQIDPEWQSSSLSDHEDIIKLMVLAGRPVATRLLLPGWTTARFFQSQLLQYRHLASTRVACGHALPQMAFPSPQYHRHPVSWLR